MIFAWFLFGVSAFLFGVTPNFWIFLGVMVFCGLSMPIYNTPAMTVLQQKVDPAFMGRVFSVITMISSIIMPLGMVVFGPLSDRISLDAIIITTGLLTIGIGIYLFTDKILIEAGRPE